MKAGAIIPVRRTRLIAAFVAALMFATNVAPAGEIGHYAPGVASIRDYTVPDAGFYGALSNYWYSTSRLNDQNGNKISAITINPGPGPGVTLSVDADIDAYSLSPQFTWVSDWRVFGARYAAYIAPSFANSSVAASLASAGGRGISRDLASSFGVADLFVQPFWLGWSLPHWEIALGYGFYAPTGRYSTESVTLPGRGRTTVEASDNLGLGFWEYQIQGAVTWYPWADQRMAVLAALTYGIPRDKQGFDLTPGQNLSLNWGISHYLPLSKDQTLLLELGVTGYDSWQLTNDTGSDATNPNVQDEVHAVGLQLGLTFVPQTLTLNLLVLYEFVAKDRFQGTSLGLNLAKKF
jgi:hypothetical protein